MPSAYPYPSANPVLCIPRMPSQLATTKKNGYSEQITRMSLSGSRPSDVYTLFAQPLEVDMRRFTLALLSAALIAMAPGVAAQELISLQVYAGFLTEPPDNLPLQLPELSLTLDNRTTSYTASLPYSATGVSLVATTDFGWPNITVSGTTPDGTEVEFSSWTYSGHFGTESAVLSSDGLQVGDNTIRIATEVFFRRVIYTVVVNRAATASGNASLKQLELSTRDERFAAFETTPDFAGATMSFEMTPDFASATTSYEVDVPGSANSLTVTTAAEHAGGVVNMRGVAADGQALVLDGARLSGLAVGTNTLEVAVTAEDGSTTSVYTVAVTRLVPDDDATLHDLQLSEGLPSRGFTLSAMAGELPKGDLTPSVAFDAGVTWWLAGLVRRWTGSPSFHANATSYTVAVSQPELTLRLRAAASSGVAVAGRSSTGAELSDRNRSRVVNDSMQFLSTTLSGLSTGENLVKIVVIAEDETTQSYTLVVTR